jgi:uncharacterized protein (TIGR03435 family)
LRLIGPLLYRAAADIHAKAARAYTLDDLHTMFQNLLADEFKLKFHQKIRQGPVYMSVVDKSGATMKVNDSPQGYEIPMALVGPGKEKASGALFNTCAIG